jgi:transposase
MANQLTMAKIEAILALHRRNWSNRQIAKELGIHRDTVARHVQLFQQDPQLASIPDDGSEAKPATPEGAPPGQNRPPQPGAPPGSKPARAPIGSEAQPASAEPTSATNPPSLCEPFRAVILTKLEQNLTAQRIYQDLVTEHGFAGKYHSVRRFIRRLGRASALPFRRLECAPGEEAQVDFGTAAPIRMPDGKRRRPYVFRIVLSHSRKAYSEAVCRQTTEDFVRCLENAFWYFGGVPQRIVLDNLRAAVRQADWFDPELNPKVRSFAAHYGTVFLPTRPYTPRHKGKVERGIGYVKENALKGREFVSLAEENCFLLDWEQTVADTRIHGTTRRQVGKLFQEIEKPALLPLPVGRFPFFEEAQRTVHRDGHVEVAKAFYSVPPEYLGRRLWVRWDARLVRIFNDRLEQIAVHVRHEPGRFSTQGEHIAAEKISGIERGAEWLLQRISRIGPQASQWVQGAMATRGIEGVRVLQGLLALAKKHSARSIEQACAAATSYDSYHLRTVRKLIGRQAPHQQCFDFIDQHPLIRPLSVYQQLVSASTKEVSQ